MRIPAKKRLFSLALSLCLALGTAVPARAEEPEPPENETEREFSAQTAGEAPEAPAELPEAPAELPETAEEAPEAPEELPEAPAKAPRIGGDTMVGNFVLDEKGTIVSYLGTVPSDLVLPSDPRVTGVSRSFLGANTTKLVSLTVPGNIKSFPRIPINCVTTYTIQRVELQSGVTTVGSSAFEDCIRLTELILPDTLEDIPTSMANGCTSLESIDIPASVRTIGTTAFYECKSLRTVRFHGNNLTSIGINAFIDTPLTRVELPDSVTTLEYNAFDGCKQLTYAKLSKGLTALPNSLFQDCAALREVDLNGAAIRKLGMSVFQGCASLETVRDLGLVGGVLVLPDTLNCPLPTGLFTGCKRLTSVTVPGSMVHTEGYMAFGPFENCTGLKTAVLGEGIEYANNCFKGCTALTEVSLPSTLRYTNSMVQDCTALNHVNYGGTAQQWAAIPDDPDDAILARLTQEGKVTFSDPPVTGDWEGSGGLGWSWQHGRLSVTGTMSGPVTAVCYNADGRMLSLTELADSRAYAALPAGTDTVKLLLLSQQKPAAPACVIRASQLSPA